MTSQTPRSTLHLEAWARYFSYSIDIDNQLNSKELERIQGLLNPINAF